MDLRKIFIDDDIFLLLSPKVIPIAKKIIFPIDEIRMESNFLRKNYGNDSMEKNCYKIHTFL